MSVMLARFHKGAFDVHAWRVFDVDYGLVRSACQLTADPEELERVEAFTGAPCNTCALLASTAAESVLREIEPVYEADDSGRYAVALRGDLETHFVGDGALRKELDGRPVVLTLCSRLAWGPLTTAPGERPICPECEQVRKEANECQ